MRWIERYYNLPQYKYAGTNQHGDRFKRVPTKNLNIARMDCEISDSADVQTLILFSHTLNVPVHYDFENHTAYIEVMSADAVRGKV